MAIKTAEALVNRSEFPAEFIALHSDILFGKIVEKLINGFRNYFEFLEYFSNCPKCRNFFFLKPPDYSMMAENFNNYVLWTVIIRSVYS